MTLFLWSLFAACLALAVGGVVVLALVALVDWITGLEAR